MASSQSAQWSVDSNSRHPDINATPNSSDQAHPQIGTRSPAGALRFAAGRSSTGYPLPIHDHLTWRNTDQADHWRAEIGIENLFPGELLLPSVVLQTSTHYAVRCSLTTKTYTWWLSAISTNQAAAGFATHHLASSPADSNSPASITSHIDVFAVHRNVAQATLCIDVVNQSRPTDYLVVVTRRQQTITPSGPVLKPASPRAEVKVPSISQMMQPLAQRNRTCSPTSLSMLMSYYGAPYHPAFIEHCKEPQSGIFGVWPLNMMQASRRGFIGAVELVSDWQALAQAPQPFVASIRFEADQLTGAPLKQTEGHLVLVRGTTANTVLCSDPAAATASSVEREYDLTEFSDAWLRYRGATYIISPADNVGEDKIQTQ